ncbi:hypothetical protein [Chitinivorax sp. B]|uniref:hypothetical protein n=1 Tax=Chitinivorax sp. B TaxID=2502235 RepID=UPI0010F48E11|nr:hypothetical protein [Chitinivorax sp. B]
MNHYREVTVAANALHAATKRANESIATLNGWLMVATGAAFSLVISNVEKISPSLSLKCLKLAMALLLGSLLLGLLAKLLIGMVSAGIGSQEDGQALAAQLQEGQEPFDVDVFISEFSRGLFPPYRWIAAWSMQRSKSGDIAAGQRYIAKLSQSTAVIVLLQAVVIISAGGVAVAGIGSLP